MWNEPNGPWTRHGHMVVGVTVMPTDPTKWPSSKDCGGTYKCEECQADAARLQAEAGQ